MHALPSRATRMYQTLEIDLTTLGSNVPEGQPAMVWQTMT